MYYLYSDFDEAKANKRLLKHGFFDKKKASDEIKKYLDEKDISIKQDMFKQLKDSDIAKCVLHETAEVTRGKFAKTGYPTPNKHQVMAFYDPAMTNLEEAYFWILGNLRDAGNLNKVYKITDSFAGSSQSSFFGASNQRVGMLQDKISGTLQSIGMLTKDMFPQIHELHIWDERQMWYSRADEGDQAADITLKGTWIDMIEGGSENAGSVYGLANKVGFAILPDLFFNTFIKDPKDVDKEVEKQCGDFNGEVKTILKRKLFQYLVWKRESQKEVTVRRNFLIKYLRQHYNTLKMYMNWVKPYLKQLKHAQQNVDFNDRPEMVNFFENSVMEVEILATEQDKNETVYAKDSAGKDLKIENHKPVCLINFYFTTQPDMNITDPSHYHRGPSHAGEIFMTFRTYGWTETQIQNYRKMRDDEDLDYLSEIDGGLKASIESFEEDLRKYFYEDDKFQLNDPKRDRIANLEKQLKEYEGVDGKKPKKKKAAESKGDSVLDPFLSIGSGFKDIFGSFVPSFKFDSFNMSQKTIDMKKKKANNQEAAAKSAGGTIKRVHKNFRKAHKMVTW